MCVCVSARVQPQPDGDRSICVYFTCLCLCAAACVYLCVHLLCLILRSSSVHPLILLTYSPNPVIPRSVFFFHPSLYPFISLSCYRSLTSTAHLPPLPSPPICSGLTIRICPFSLYHFQSFILPMLRCSIPARLSRCLKAWHQGFSCAGFCPSQKKMQRKELHSHLCKLSTS